MVVVEVLGEYQRRQDIKNQTSELVNESLQVVLS